LREWSIVERLPAIDVPALLLSSRHDEATPGTVQPDADMIPDVRWRLFEYASHMPHVEERAACMQVLGAYLAEHDR
jgi:L-proline amide hydrolase